jgi:hypothetical protein
MAKDDYKDANVKAEYKNLVEKKTLTKINVEEIEKRSRAELLDMVEELFETKDGGITALKLRAFLHMFVKNITNPTDDSPVSASDIANFITISDIPAQKTFAALASESLAAATLPTSTTKLLAGALYTQQISNKNGIHKVICVV